MKQSSITFLGAVVLIIIFNSCDFLGFADSSKKEFTIKDTDKYYYYQLDGDTLRKPVNLEELDTLYGDYAVISTKNEGSSLNIKTKEPKLKTIDLEIYLDKSFQSTDDFIEKDSINEKLVNHILKKLNFGFQIKIWPIQYDSLSQIKTDGKINQNTIFNNLPKNGALKWHVYLFNRSDFFNTANAVCLKNGDEVYIMGDGNLLQSPMLFIHELGHALGLTHSNTEYTQVTTQSDICGDTDNSKFYNIMHESNIGCSRYLSHRQFFIAHDKKFVEPLIGQDSAKFEEICGCRRIGMDNNTERYVNSFDKNIDDTPIIGDASTLINQYRKELAYNVLGSELKNNFEYNFGLEYDSFVSGFDTSVINKEEYIDKRVKNHRKLRRNNLARWLRENQKLQGNLIDTTYYFYRPPMFYKDKFKELASSCCFDLHNEIAELLNMIKELETKIDNSIVYENEQADSTWYNCFYEILNNSENNIPSPVGGGQASIQSQNNYLKQKLRYLLLKDF